MVYLCCYLAVKVRNDDAGGPGDGVVDVRGGVYHHREVKRNFYF